MPRFVPPLSLPLDLDALALPVDDAAEQPEDLLLAPILDGMCRFRVDHRRYSLVSWRHNLIKLLTTPFSRDRSWAIDVENIAETLFFGIVHEVAEQASDDWQQRCIRWGRTFERVCTSTDPPRPFCRVIETGLADRRWLIGTELDAEGMELKTHSLSSDLGPSKALKIWAQCYLAGIEEVVIGHRDNNGCVRRISHMQTLSLPTRSASPICIAFLDYALDWIAKTTSAAITSKHGDGYRLSFDYPFTHLVLEPRSGTNVLTRAFYEQLPSTSSP